MRSIAETLNEMAQSWQRRMTDEQKADAEDILDAAEQVGLGVLPVHEFARLSTGRMRFDTLVATAKEDPRREPLLRAIDAVILFNGFVITTSGVWSPEVIGMAGMRVHPAPVLDPWSDAA